MQNGGGGDRDEERRKGRPTNPTPSNKIRYKIAKLAAEEEGKKSVLQQSPTSPHVVSLTTQSPVDGSSSNSQRSLSGDLEPRMKKLKIPPSSAAEMVSPVNKTPSLTRAMSNVSATAVNFGPFSPAGFKAPRSYSKKSTNHIRVIEPKPAPAIAPTSIPKTGSNPIPKPGSNPKLVSEIRSKPKPGKRFLGPNQVTYLRSKPPNRAPVHASDPDPNTPMGPPEPRICRTPYETVKKALSFLKSELGLTTFPSSTPPLAAAGWMEIAPEPPLPSYSLSEIPSSLALSIEEVIMELDEYVNSMPKTISSESMKWKLLQFQKKMGLPPKPLFYNLMWSSATTFLGHLARYFPYDRA